MVFKNYIFKLKYFKLLNKPEERMKNMKSSLVEFKIEKKGKVIDFQGGGD